MSQGILLAFVAMISWGISDIVIKLVLDRVSKWYLLFAAQLIGGLSILGFAFFWTGGIEISAESLLFLMGLAGMNMFGMWAFYQSIKKKGVTLSLPIIYSWPFLAAILAMFVYDESVSILQWASIAMIVFGIYLITVKKFKGFEFDRSFMFAVVSMLTWSVFFLLLRPLNALLGPILAASLIKVFSGVFAAPVLMKKNLGVERIKGKMLPTLALVGVLDAVGLLAFNFAIEIAPLSSTSAILAATPVFAVVLGFIFLSERPNRREAYGVAVTLLGLILVSI